MAHPLNHPVYDAQQRRVVKGYGILQPGLAEEMPRHGQGRYAAICSSVPGNDPYSMMSSDIYQDLFGEGTFVGKGIYDVDVFAQATCNIGPENLVLSHDLLEGCYARSGLLSEVLLYEQYPVNYLTIDSVKRIAGARPAEPRPARRITVVPGPAAALLAKPPCGTFCPRAEQRPSNAAAPEQPRNMGLFRNIYLRRRQLAAAGQLSGAAPRHDCPPHLADQYRPVADG
ncbi:hypothetical protein VRC35_10660 [Erwinia aphidicola]